MGQQKYIIAPKREFRNSVPPDWQERLKQIKGVRVIADQPARLQVQATPQVIAKVSSMFGGMYHIEAIIPHSRQDFLTPQVTVGES